MIRSFLLSLLLLGSAFAAPAPLALRYTQPAEKWTEALPVGNGRLGAMVFGGVTSERLQLNEATLWSGAPRDWNNPGARAILPDVRAAALAGDYAKATELSKQMQGLYSEAYMPLADLKLSFWGFEGTTNYERTLDLSRAVSIVRFQAGGATYTREVFSSFPDQVIVVRLSCDQPGKINVSVGADSLLRHAVKTDGTDTLLVTGRAPAHADPSYHQGPKPIQYDDGANPEGTIFDLRVRVVIDGGRIVAGGATVRAEKANSVTLLVSAATSFNGALKSPGREGRDPAPLAEAPLQAAGSAAYTDLLARHIADYQKFFHRVALDLGTSPEAEALTTDARLARFAQGASDPGLSTLLYQYGRYLLIASSRPGGQPAHLQGLWNDSMQPPWSSNFTLNINTEMHYWPAEVNYGARGWVAHHNSDIWAQTCPVGNFGTGDPKWASWSMSAGWLSQHLWEHYAFGRDEQFLRMQAWPIMQGAAEFCLDWLVDDGHGRLLTAPSTSPELAFKTADGKQASVATGATMDMSIIRDLFRNCLEAARVLGIDNEFTHRVAAAQAKLLPLQVGARGQLQEWAADLAEVGEHHRHTSHLFDVYPGR